MKVDTDKIEWLLSNATQYRINKDTGVNLSILGRLVRGERKIENLTIKTGSTLTEYAEKLQKQENQLLLFDYPFDLLFIKNNTHFSNVLNLKILIYQRFIMISDVI